MYAHSLNIRVADSEADQPSANQTDYIIKVALWAGPAQTRSAKRAFIYNTAGRTVDIEQLDRVTR